MLGVGKHITIGQLAKFYISIDRAVNLLQVLLLKIRESLKEMRNEKSASPLKINYATM